MKEFDSKYTERGTIRKAIYYKYDFPISRKERMEAKHLALRHITEERKIENSKKEKPLKEYVRKTGGLVATTLWEKEIIFKRQEFQELIAKGYNL